MLELIEKYYRMGLYTGEDLAEYVQSGVITQQQARGILADREED